MTPNKKSSGDRSGLEVAASKAALTRAVASLPLDWRIKAAQSALPYVHVKPERPPATDPAATATQIESGSDTDPLAEAIKAFRRGDLDWQIEKSKGGSES